jgi:hypothetical protein
MFAAFIPNSGVIEQVNSKELAHREAKDLLNEIPTAAGDIYVVEYGNNGLILTSWLLTPEGDLEDSDEFIGDNVNSL